MLTIILWSIIFIISIVAVVKGADWLLEGAEKVGFAAGLSPFIVGVIIVGLGTSFPELITSFVALIEGVPEVVPANAIGSNIANILLVVGISAILARKLVMAKSLIDLDLPLLVASTFLFVGVAWDGTITFLEAILLLVGYVIYFAYSIYEKEDDDVKVPTEDPIEILPSRKERRHKSKNKAVQWKDILFLLIGILVLSVGSKFLIDSVITLSALFGIATGIITMAAVALGTSLPELLVSIKAAWQKKSEVALGNVFGSNVFNLLVVVGLPGLFGDLTLGSTTVTVGLPVLIGATLLFVFSGISKRIHMWEGALYVLLYIFFILKIFGVL